MSIPPTEDARPTPVPAPPPAVGSTVGEYELLGEIARGGMGVVYKARHGRLGRVVALKMIRDIGGDSVERFRREAEAVAQLDHPNIVPIYEVGTDAGRPYFAMKLIDGGSLARTLAGDARPPLRRLIEVLRDVALAMHYAHQRGVIHRDLKPANVLLDPEGRPHVTDFGLARRVEGEGLTQTGAIVGTPAYMAPEQAKADRGGVTVLTDVYALGAILYEFLTGRPPFEADTPLETVLRVLERDPVPPGGDRGLEAVCLKCLAKDPQARYPSAQALADDLTRWLAGEPLSVRPPGAAARLIRWVRQNVRAALWVGLIAVVGSGVASLLFFQDFFRTTVVGVSRAYDLMPSAPRPPLLGVLEVLSLGTGEVPLSVVVAGGVAMRLFFGCIGLLVVLAARPKDVHGSLALGFGTGLVAAMVAYAVIIGPYISFRLSLSAQVKDLQCLSYGCMQPNEDFDFDFQDPKAAGAFRTGREALLHRYPELGGDEPSHRLYAKMHADLAVVAFQSVWIGMSVALLLCVGPIVAQALLAGYLTQRQPPGPVVLPYLEGAAVASWLLLEVIAHCALAPLIGEPFGVSGWCVVSLGGLLALAILGAALRWTWPLRWSVYATFVFALYAAGFQGWQHTFQGLYTPTPGPVRSWLGLAAFTALSAVLLVRHRRRPTV